MPTLNSQDLELEKYFTDVEVLRDWFDKAIVAETLPKRLLVIHGVGGIGKSSLLRMFRLNCKTAHVPVALTSGDEAKSAVDVLTRWGEDLKADGVNLPTFFKTYEHYRAIQAKVEDETSKAQKKLGDIAGKATSKTAEAAGGAALGAALGSVVPGIGTAPGAALGGVIGGMGAEALVDYLRGFLSKPDIDLLLDPSKKLTDDFLADVNQAASSRRVVLMLDTYEQMTALDDWTRDVAQRLNENILLVIAGRAMVNWGRQWSSWLMHAEVQELKPMSKRVMHELIRKYYATMRGGEPNPKQVNAIIEFSGGLPMVVNTVVQLWVKYGVEDFGEVKGEVVREVVARLREGVPAELYPLLETAAALRYFNKEILRAVSGMGDINASYDELRRFPFVRSRAEGYALHDRVRDMIEENVRTDDPAKFRALHERAAAYFEARMAYVSGEEAERLGLERLYHRVCADEESGMKLFQEMAEEVAQYRLVNRLRELLNELDRHNLRMTRSLLWRDYYYARLAFLQFAWEEAESFYLRIIVNQMSENKLQAYALCDYGELLARFDRLGHSSGITEAIGVLEKSLAINILDSHTINAHVQIARVALYDGDWEKQINHTEKAIEFFKAKNDTYGLATVYTGMQSVYARRGLWKEYFKMQETAISLFSLKPKPSALRLNVLGRWVNAVVNAGRYRESVSQANSALMIAKDLADELFTLQILRDLGFALCKQDRFDEAYESVEQSLLIVGHLGGRFLAEFGASIGVLGKIQLESGDFSKAIGSFREAFEIRTKFNNWFGILLSLTDWANLLERTADWSGAESKYQECSKLSSFGALYLNCQSNTGMVRVKHAQHDYAAIPPLLAEAEQLALQYEYNDHLASLRLTQGHIAWETSPLTPLLVGEGQGGEVAAFEFYKLALTYALRYNRFLLDEVLSGRPQGTPLRPIIPECLKRGEEGRRMLLTLREWWQTGTNDVGTPRPDTISPIPENIALLEAEKIAREREPGNGTKQRWVVEQIEAALV